MPPQGTGAGRVASPRTGQLPRPHLVPGVAPSPGREGFGHPLRDNRSGWDCPRRPRPLSVPETLPVPHHRFRAAHLAQASRSGGHPAGLARERVWADPDSEGVGRRPPLARPRAGTGPARSPPPPRTPGADAEDWETGPLVGTLPGPGHLTLECRLMTNDTPARPEDPP